MSTTQSPTVGASAEAVEFHYDLSNEFYALWLDPTLTYSCALWEPGDTLERAQLRKLDWVIDAAGVGAGDRVLDVGCGWGSLMTRMVRERGVDRAVGLTLSRAQADWIAASCGDPCEVRLEDWRDHQPEAPYDAVVSVGAMEHFMRFGRPRAEKVEAYRDFFRRCHDTTVPGAGMGLQTIAKGNVPLDSQTLEDLMFIVGDVFPESDVPRLAEIAHAAEKLFEVVAVRNDRRDYARTCAEWLERLRARRAEATELVGEDVVEKYVRFLQASIRQFESGATVLLRMSLRRV